MAREGIQVAGRSWEVSAVENLRRVDTAPSSAMRSRAGMCFCPGTLRETPYGSIAWWFYGFADENIFGNVKYLTVENLCFETMTLHQGASVIEKSHVTLG